MRALRGVLVVDVADCLDDLGHTTPAAVARAWSVLAAAGPGRAVTVALGEAQVVTDALLDVLAEQLAAAEVVQVTGACASAVDAVVRGLSRRLGPVP